MYFLECKCLRFDLHSLECDPVDPMNKSTLVEVMTWCHQAPSHYPNQCWPRSMMTHCVTSRLGHIAWNYPWVPFLPKWYPWWRKFYLYAMVTHYTHLSICAGVLNNKIVRWEIRNKMIRGAIQNINNTDLTRDSSKNHKFVYYWLWRVMIIDNTNISKNVCVHQRKLIQFENGYAWHCCHTRINQAHLWGISLVNTPEQLAFAEQSTSSQLLDKLVPCTYHP